MRTTLTALAAFGGCTAARWYLDRSSRREETRFGVQWTALRNAGAAFGLPAAKEALPLASAAALGAVWAWRDRSPLGAGLMLGGGLGNLSERLWRGEVYDYLRFPRAPGPLKRYVFNLADGFIFAGGILLLAGRKKKSRREKV